jgi:uncharacterized protein
MRKALVLLSSALLVFAVTTAWIVLYPSVPADLGGVPDLDTEAARVRIPVGEGDHLDGWLLAGRRRATVVLFAGYARDHRRSWRYAHFLRREGWSVLAVDFRSARERDRKPTTLGHYEREDARATLDWLRAQPMHERDRVALFGESLGGAVALAIAAERSEVVAVVADCPFATGEAAIDDGVRFVGRLPAWPLGPITRELGRAVTGYDPGALDVTVPLRSLDGRPVLLIQTTVEDRFGREQVARLEDATGRSAVTWTVDDARHTEVWVEHRDEYERRVVGFLAPHLGGGLAARGLQGARAGGDAVADGARATGGAVVRGARAGGSAVADGARAGGSAVAEGARRGGRAVAEGARSLGRAVASPFRRDRDERQEPRP